jgi:hypothetical protein
LIDVCEMDEMLHSRPSSKICGIHNADFYFLVVLLPSIL